MKDKILIASAPTEKPRNYAKALLSVGVPEDRIQVVMPGEHDADEVRRMGAQAAGLVLSGGPDIHPKYFGEEELPGANLSIQDDRDAMEWALLEGAKEAKTPTWCVCRGMQIANTFLGGDLWQDLPSQVPGLLLHRLSFPGDALIHTIEVPKSADTWLGDVLGREMALVNSRHHQGVRKLAPGIVNVGQAPDGLVEAISWAADDWWLHGVQWHPENLTAMEQERELWTRFVDRVDGR